MRRNLLLLIFILISMNVFSGDDPFSEMESKFSSKFEQMEGDFQKMQDEVPQPQYFLIEDIQKPVFNSTTELSGSTTEIQKNAVKIENRVESLIEKGRVIYNKIEELKKTSGEK